MTVRTPRVLSIAGSDSGGGAGIQADLKAFARCGVHGMTAITAITAQNTLGVSDIHQVPPEIILAQVRAVVQDIGVDAVKVGMLGSVGTARAVLAALDELPVGTPVVVDPVMLAESGALLLEPEAREVLTMEILRRVTVVTPNLPEARALLGLEPGVAVSTDAGAGVDGDDDDEAVALARGVQALGPAVAVVTGGHRERAVDVFFDGESVVAIGGARHPGGAAHGSGCTHSSVLAAGLALGLSPLEAARLARELVGAAVASGLRDIGHGAGPVDVLGLGGLRPQ